MQPQPAAQAGPQAAQQQTLGNEWLRSRRGFYPRWPLLAALVYIPVLALIYGANEFVFSANCLVQPVCVVEQWPPLAHYGLALLGYLIAWRLALFFGMAPFEFPRPGDSFAALGEKLSNPRTSRWPLSVYTSLCLVGVAVLLVLGHTDMLLLAMVTILLFVTVCCLLYRPPRNQAPLTAQQQYEMNLRQQLSPWVLLRTSWPFSIWARHPTAQRRGRRAAPVGAAPQPPPAGPRFQANDADNP